MKRVGASGSIEPATPSERATRVAEYSLEYYGYDQRFAAIERITTTEQEPASLARADA